MRAETKAAGAASVKPKPPIPLSTCTRAVWTLPGNPGTVHRLKVDPSGMHCQVSLCGLTVAAGNGEAWRWEPNIGRAVCPECERAAREATG